MTEQDEARIRRMIEDVIGKPLEILNSHIALIHVQNARIEEQTTKHNNRMSKIEDKIENKILPEISNLNHINSLHYYSCQNTKDITEIKKKEFGRNEVMKFAGIVSTAIATAISLFIAWLNL